ncbi:MAG: hypothetical protein DRQ47_04495 [Gammaproteobacteria bacterium]|nr:MAG: hypothetical protein DRQ47_04495 [Gammaproteobacteria bacterium]
MSKNNVFKKWYVTTANGKTEIVPVQCEVTNTFLGWRTVMCNSELEITPAFISLKAVTKKGKVKFDFSNITTF